MKIYQAWMEWGYENIYGHFDRTKLTSVWYNKRELAEKHRQELIEKDERLKEIYGYSYQSWIGITEREVYEQFQERLEPRNV